MFPDLVEAEAVGADVGFVLDRQDDRVRGDLELDRLDAVGDTRYSASEMGRAESTTSALPAQNCWKAWFSPSSSTVTVAVPPAAL